MNITHATYTGPLAHLQGQPALVMANGDTVLAQFDDKYLTRDGLPMPQQLEYEPHARFPTVVDLDTPPPQALGFGWHAFSTEDFRLCDK